MATAPAALGQHGTFRGLGRVKYTLAPKRRKLFVKRERIRINVMLEAEDVKYSPLPCIAIEDTDEPGEFRYARTVEINGPSTFMSVDPPYPRDMKGPVLWIETEAELKVTT